jgi:predicted nucleic-acid-binding protein
MRKTVDTNVLVRALVQDGGEQSCKALACVTEERVHVPTTVLLETEWVLRSSFAVSRAKIVELFGSLVGMANVEFDDRTVVSNAIAALREGMDFADALHAFGSGTSGVFLTFDVQLRRKAKRLIDSIQVTAP